MLAVYSCGIYASIDAFSGANTSAVTPNSVSGRVVKTVIVLLPVFPNAYSKITGSVCQHTCVTCASNTCSGAPTCLARSSARDSCTQ